MGAGAGDDQRLRPHRGHRVCVDQRAAEARNIGDVVPIGSPVARGGVVRAGRWLRPVPAGVVGELYVAGGGVGVGYLASGRV